MSAPQHIIDTAQDDELWWNAAMQAVRVAASTGRPFQCYSLVLDYGLPEPRSPKHWGALMGAARQAGIVRAVGAEESRRPTTARSLTRVWRGTPAHVRGAA